MLLKTNPAWAQKSHTIAVKAFGTDCKILFCAEAGPAEHFSAKACAWLVAFEARYSIFKPDSLISRINRMAGVEAVRIDEELAGILNICDLFHWSTKGLFDPSALPLMKLWDYRSEQPRVPSEEEIKHAKTLVGWSRIRRDGDSIMLPTAEMGIDLGGFGKEFAIDRVMQMALESGIEDVMVDFGCDIRVHGVPPQGGLWRIGIEDPNANERCEFGIGIADKAIATSGDYRRNFISGGRRFGHIIDPRTGYPADSGCLSVSVVASTCVEAGVLARSAFILGPGDGLSLMRNFAQVDGAIVTGTSRYETSGFGRYVLENNKARAMA